jgi:hypothetical protein
VCSVSTVRHCMRGRRLRPCSPRGCGDWPTACQKTPAAGNRQHVTSLRPAHRTWPTSMDAVFRRLAHGVYTMPTLFSLHPWMLFCFTCMSSQHSSARTDAHVPVSRLATTPTQQTGSLWVRVEHGQACQAITSWQQSSSVSAGMASMSTPSGSRRYTCADDRSSTWNLR